MVLAQHMNQFCKCCTTVSLMSAQPNKQLTALLKQIPGDSHSVADMLLDLYPYESKYKLQAPP